MEFTVFTSAGGFREFPGDSSYRIGEANGVLYVTDGTTGQMLAYGPSAWASVQEWQRDAVVLAPAGEMRKPAVVPAPAPEPTPAPVVAAEPGPVRAPAPSVAAEPGPLPASRQFDPLFDPLDTWAD
jgi:hypothetical protein